MSEDRKEPDAQEEQQNFPSSTCLTSSPMNQDPAVTSSWEYVRRNNLQNQNHHQYHYFVAEQNISQEDKGVMKLKEQTC